jgi:hypothetical protein
MAETACLFSTPSSQLQLDLFCESGALAQKAVETARDRGRTCISAIKAAQLIADIPLMMSIHGDQKMPIFGAIQKHYLRSIDNTRMAIAANEACREQGDFRGNTDTAGHVGEMATRLLLQRYGIREIGDNSWLPMAAHLSQDRGARSKTLAGRDNPSWDISVFTQCDPQDKTDVPYKIQVKTHSTIGDGNYSDDITVVTADHLTVQHERNTNFYKIFRELMAEEVAGRNGVTHALPESTRLDMRTELLTSILG